MPRSAPSPRRRATRLSDGAAVLVGVGVVVLCWVLLMPPGSGPDEPGHLVRSGAVVRGEFGDLDTFALPDDYQIAEPGCYAFQPEVAVTCSANPARSGATLDLPSRAGEYPIWGHALFGLPTVLPGLEPLWWARLVGGVLATVLVGWSLARAARVSVGASAGLLLGVTPMAWSTFGTVNPSSIGIAGAVALWTGLLLHDDGTTGHGARGAAAHDRPDSWGRRLLTGAGWLTAIGWGALVLPRRDGLVWACIALVVALAATRRTAPSWWRSLTRPQQATILATTLVTLVWGAASGTRSTQFLVLAPLLIAASEGWRWWWHRPVHTDATRWASAGVFAAVGVLAAYVLVSTRPGGWDTDLAIDVVMQTDDNLVEAIGVLGWLDAVIPAGAVDLWLIAIGMLLAVAVVRRADRCVISAVALAGATMVTSWMLELVQGNTTGTYWQGRYSLPLIVGIPLLLTIGGRTSVARAATAHRVVGVSGLVVTNVAAWAAARRFGVGVSGSLLPWRWDTPIQPVPPVLLLVVHAAACVWLASIVLRSAPTRSDDG